MSNMSALCWIFHTMSLWNLFFSSQHPYCSFVMTALKTKACKQDSAVMNIFPMFVLQPLCTRDLYTSFIITWIFVSCVKKNIESCLSWKYTKTKGCKPDRAVMNIFPIFVLQLFCTRGHFFKTRPLHNVHNNLDFCTFCPENIQPCLSSLQGASSFKITPAY